jgi:hypothetical protein
MPVRRTTGEQGAMVLVYIKYMRETWQRSEARGRQQTEVGLPKKSWRHSAYSLDVRDLSHTGEIIKIFRFRPKEPHKIISHLTQAT